MANLWIDFTTKFCPKIQKLYSLAIVWSANQQINIIKIACKVLSCVGARKLYHGSKFHAFLVVEILKIRSQNPCISARWSTSFNVHHILHIGTWLRCEHSSKCCSVSCNSVVLRVINWRKHCRSMKDDNQTTITRNYKFLGVTGDAPTKLGEEHWLQQTKSQNATGKNGSIFKYFFRFPLQGMHGYCCHDSVFPTHNNALQVILKISIFWFVDPIYRSLIWCNKAL